MGRAYDHPRYKAVDPDRLGIIYLRGETRSEVADQVIATHRHVEGNCAEWLTGEYADNAREELRDPDKNPGEYIWHIEDRAEPNSDEIHVAWDLKTGDPTRPGRRATLAYLQNETPAAWLVTWNAAALIDHRYDASEIVNLIDDHGVQLFLVNQGVAFFGATNETEDALLALAGKDERSRSTPTDKPVTVENLTGNDNIPLYEARARYNGGRPPFGFEVDDGELVQEPEYDEICEVVQRVKDGEMSKKKAAERLGCARATISNCLDRPKLYQLG